MIPMAVDGEIREGETAVIGRERHRLAATEGPEGILRDLLTANSSMHHQLRNSEQPQFENHHSLVFAMIVCIVCER